MIRKTRDDARLERTIPQSAFGVTSRAELLDRRKLGDKDIGYRPHQGAQEKARRSARA